MPEADPAAVSPIDGNLLCPACGYNLRGLTFRRCPECGGAFDLDRLSRTDLPWAHRRAIGRARAYWHTVNMVTFRPRRLAEQMAYPLDGAACRRFRLITVALAWLPVLFTAFYNGDGHARTRWILFDAGGYSMAVTLIAQFCALLTLVLITGLAGFAVPRSGVPVELQSRATSLSRYTTAPLAFGPLVWFFGLGLERISGQNGVLLVTGLLLGLVQLVLASRALAAIRTRGLGLRGARSTLLVPLTLLVLWLLTIPLVHLTVWIVVLFAANVWSSLRA